MTDPLERLADRPEYTSGYLPGLSLWHHLYPGNRADPGELPEALTDRCFAGSDSDCSDTLLLDKVSAALANMLELEKAAVGWI